jgi:hypothetical protein
LRVATALTSGGYLYMNIGRCCAFPNTVIPATHDNNSPELSIFHPNFTTAISLLLLFFSILLASEKAMMKKKKG